MSLTNRCRTRDALHDNDANPNRPLTPRPVPYRRRNTGGIVEILIFGLSVLLAALTWLLYRLVVALEPKP